MDQQENEGPQIIDSSAQDDDYRENMSHSFARPHIPRLQLASQTSSDRGHAYHRQDVHVAAAAQPGMTSAGLERIAAFLAATAAPSPYQQRPSMPRPRTASSPRTPRGVVATTAPPPPPSRGTPQKGTPVRPQSAVALRTMQVPAPSPGTRKPQSPRPSPRPASARGTARVCV